MASKHYPLTAETIEKRIQRDQTTGHNPAWLRAPVSLEEVRTIALTVAARYQVALWHGWTVRAAELEKQARLLTEYANQIA